MKVSFKTLGKKNISELYNGTVTKLEEQCVAVFYVKLKSMNDVCYADSDIYHQCIYSRYG